MLLSLIGGKGKLILFAVLAAGIASAVAYHYWTVNKLQKDNAQLVLNNTVLEENYRKANNAAQSNRAAILILEEQRKVDQQKINELAEKYAESRRSIDELAKTFSEKDIGVLAYHKPGLIERIVNRGTADVGKEIEQLTRRDQDE